MPIDTYDNEEEKGDGAPQKKYQEFDCPLCNANNPLDEGFQHGDYIRCFYCGAEFLVKIDEGGRVRLRET